MQKIPFLTTQQMVEVDRAMIKDYHIELIQMMENAGRNLAHLARSRFLDGDPRGKQVVVLAGRGGNGGGGLVCARRLANWGTAVTVFITAPDTEYRGVAAHQLDILQRMGVTIEPAERAEVEFHPADLIIDALIGYSLSGNPHGRAAQLINSANALDTPILSLDVPSGVDAATGEIRQPAITATATMTLALPKQGLLPAQEAGLTGELYLADISVPPALYDGLDLATAVAPIFAQDEIIRLL